MQRTANPIIHRLEQKLETNAPREEIAEALAAAEALGDALPPLLAFRARERIEADRFLDRRRICFGIACSLLLFVAAFSAVGLTTLDRMRTTNRDEAILQQMLDDGQWDEAQAFLDSLDETRRSSQAFVRGQQTIREQLQRERSRKAEFDQLVRQIRSDASGTIDEAMVSRVDELARTEEERAVAAEISAIADQQRLLREAGRVEDQTRRFEELQQEVDDFFEKESGALSSQTRSSRTHELRRRLQQFVSENHLSNPDLAEAAKQTAELLVREDQRAQIRTEKQNLIAAVTASVGNADRFFRSIQRLVDSFPDDPAAGQLRQLVSDRRPIDAAEAWIAVLGHAAYTSPETADSDRSRQWIERLDQATELEADHPLSQNLLGWRAHYQAIAKRRELLSQIRQLFQSELFGQMYLYPDLRKGWYYSELSPNRNSPAAHVVEYFADLSLNRRTKNFGSRYRDQVVPHVQRSGHSAYAAKVASTVSQTGELDFTPGVYRLINDLRTLDVDLQFDPIFRVNVMLRLLQIGVEGSQPLRVGFEDWITALDASDFPWDANWMSPGDSDPEVAAARAQASLLLQSFDDWDERVQRMGESYRRFREPRRRPPEWIGWVAREDDRYVGLLRSASADGRLFVLASKPAGQRTSLIEIGSVTGGSTPSIDDTAAQVIGAPICIFPKPESTGPPQAGPATTEGN